MSKTAIVVGAGALGGWAALFLSRAGYKVTLLEAWSPAHARASSGDVSRIIRINHGAETVYAPLAKRAFELWHEFEEEWDIRLLERCGFLWMEGHDGDEEKATLAFMDEHRIAYEYMEGAEPAKRFPQFDFDGIRWAAYEPDAGFLYAHRSCNRVVAAFREEGGDYRREAVLPVREDEIAAGTLAELPCKSGNSYRADAYLFACGPWLGQVLPRSMGELIRPSRQDIYYFGEEAGSSDFDTTSMPTWADHSPRMFYGIPCNDGLGFKVGEHVPGETIDPSQLDRTPSAESLATVRRFLSKRIPTLKDAPVNNAKVCQYENSPDFDFILDRHPSFENVWIAGGGSGHGFKHGPAVGEIMLRLISNGSPGPDAFRFARFGAGVTPPDRTD